MDQQIEVIFLDLRPFVSLHLTARLDLLVRRTKAPLGPSVTLQSVAAGGLYVPAPITTSSVT